MAAPSLGALSEAIVASWSAETMHATPEEPSRKPGDHSRGQCGTTALVVQDWLGGEILAGEVLRDGAVVGAHYWNLLPGGVEVDLTGEQFIPEESVRGRRIAPQRPERFSQHPGYGPYRLLAERVRARLASTAPGSQVAISSADNREP